MREFAKDVLAFLFLIVVGMFGFALVLAVGIATGHAIFN